MSKMGHFCHLTFIAACIADSLYLLYIPVVLTIHGLASTQATFIDSTHGTHMLLHLPRKNKKKVRVAFQMKPCQQEIKYPKVA